MFKCKTCGKSFESELELIVHDKAFHKSSDGNCFDCKKHFKKMESLKNHIRQVHEGVVRKFNCDNCEKEFNSKSGLNNHKTTAHSKPATPSQHLQNQQNKIVVNEVFPSVELFPSHNCRSCNNWFNSYVEAKNHKCVQNDKKRKPLLQYGATYSHGPEKV